MKTTTHKTITRIAIELCKDFLSSEIFENRCSIIQGSEDEDTTQRKKRATNWHFYRDINRHSPIPRYIKILKINFYPTSENILDDRILEMKNPNNKKERKYNYLGRILHHIQDMSTPSHVIPIYHGPKAPLSISIKMIDDHFESFMERNDCRVSTKDILSLPNISGITSFVQIYEESANDMLKKILKVDEPIGNRPYSHFWKHYTEKEYKKIKGFGVYGESHKYFKKRGLPKNNPEGITMEKLLEIQDMVTTHAIVSTCKALLYADTIE